MIETLNGAYQEISMSTDPAVRYFAETLTVLPKQQRDATPCGEWLGPESYRRGMVSTPGGDVLGFIDRRTDGMWAITPSRNGPVAVSAIAESQTDARCYLADMLTRTAKLTVGNEHKQVRIVGEEYDLFKQDYASDWLQLGAPDTTFQVTFWDETHGLDIGNMVRLETECQPSEGVVQILQGTVKHVKNHEVTVEGTTYFDAKC